MRPAAAPHRRPASSIRPKAPCEVLSIALHRSLHPAAPGAMLPERFQPCCLDFHNLDVTCNLARELQMLRDATSFCRRLESEKLLSDSEPARSSRHNLSSPWVGHPPPPQLAHSMQSTRLSVSASNPVPHLMHMWHQQGVNLHVQVTSSVPT